MNQKINNIENSEKEFNIKEVFSIYLSKWKWFVVSIIVALSLGYAYLRYTLPQFEASATVLIKDDTKGNVPSEVSAFQDLGILSGNSSLDNEIEIFKSRSLIMRVAEELDLNIQYLDNNGPIARERYKNPPLRIHFTAGDTSVYEFKTEFNIHVLSSEEYELYEEGNNQKRTHKFGREVSHSIGKFIITPNSIANHSIVNKKYIIRISPLEKIVNSYKKLITITAINKESNVIQISLRDPERHKAIAIIDNLIEQHSKDAVNDKNQVSKNTAEFINERMKFITSELSDVEGNVEMFKTNHKLVDVISEAGIFLQSENENGKRIMDNETQIRLSEFVYDYLLSHNDASDLIPSNLGLSNVAIEKMIESYNTLVLERNRLLRNSTEKNPVILNLDGQIMGIHKSLKESLSNLKTSLRIQNADFKNRKISLIPK